MAKLVNAVPPTLCRYRVPQQIVQASAEDLRRLGRGIKEAVVLWQGRVVDQSIAEVTKLVVPRQETGPLHFNIPLQERLRLMQLVAAENEFILVQLHTHPREAFHSKADDTMAITKHVGAISIVIPNFGMRWSGSLAETAVFVHQGAARWSQITSASVGSLFEATA